MAKKRLRTGFSTGTAAAAAARAALETLLAGTAPARVPVQLPQGEELIITVKGVNRVSNQEAVAVVVKDAGDDPDVTNGAEIAARVRLDAFPQGEEAIRIEGGDGVGRVTRPGLPVPVGRPAINPVPLDMIRNALRQTWKADGHQTGPIRVRVEISVKDGESLARKTLNPRLGILGGISILGTTGLVKPFSHEAYTATIESALDIARAAEIAEVVLTTGGKSERYAMRFRPDLPDLAFVQIADFFGFALEESARRGFKRIGLVSFFGKAVKQAQALRCTHAHRTPMDLCILAAWLAARGADQKLVQSVAAANTARQSLCLLRENDAIGLVGEIARRMVDAAREFTKEGLDIWVKIIDYDGTVFVLDTGRSSHDRNTS